MRYLISWPQCSFFYLHVRNNLPRNPPKATVKGFKILGRAFIAQI